MNVLHFWKSIYEYAEAVVRMCSVKKVLKVLLNFAKFTGKYLCQSLFYNKVASLQSETLFKKKSGTGAFLKHLRNF